MFLFLTIIFVLIVLYVMLMDAYSRGWRLQKDFEIEPDFIPQTKISIIIPARNEAANIGNCIHSILANDYPNLLYEIIVIDDHSTDATFEIVQNYAQKNVKCLRLAEYLKEGENLVAYKKKAIEIGIAESFGELIITTDADCIVPVKWLQNFAAIYQKQQPSMIVGPVCFTSNNSIVQIFQSLDFMSMQGITVAAHKLKLGNMSNGANLAFSKAVFHRVNGYEGVDHLASGDDYLLMMKIQNSFSNKIVYLKTKEAIVQTAPQPDWKSFFNQRIRWASKSGKYDDKKLTAILVLVYLFNLSFAVVFALCFWDPFYCFLLMAMLIVKIGVELSFLRPVADFYDRRSTLFWFPILQPLHIIYIISAGFMGMIGKYQWKGRSVK